MSFFLEVADGVLHFAKAVNPLGVLAELAIAENEAGRTRSLREFAAENAISLDDDSYYNGI